MNPIQIIILFDAAVRNVRRLRFSVDIFHSAHLPCPTAAVRRGKYLYVPAGRSNPFSAGARPKKRQIINKTRIFVFLFLSLLLTCSCSSKAEEPVLESVLAEGDENTDSGDAQNVWDTQKVLTGQNAADSETGQAEENVADSGSGKVGQTPADSETGQAEQYSGTLQDDARTQNTLTVHVCGAVKKEGVYSLPAGSRIRDAIEAAGGFSDSADRSYLNLAMELEDAWQIRVPTKEETKALRTQEGASGSDASLRQGGSSFGVLTGQDTLFIVKGETSSDAAASNQTEEAGSKEGNSENERINLNTASVQELMKIPGVGETKAKRIIDYREQNGRFEAIEDIMKVPGIKNASFEKMKEYITV